MSYNSETFLMKYVSIYRICRTISRTQKLEICHNLRGGAYSQVRLIRSCLKSSNFTDSDKDKTLFTL